jgi:hypothetical protein
LLLAVSQTREAHERLTDLLAQLREVRHKQQEADAHAAPKPKEPKEPEKMVVEVHPLRVSTPAPAMTPQETAEVVKALVEPNSWTAGEAYIRGMAGERFGVRNSGAVAVIWPEIRRIGALPIRHNGRSALWGIGRDAKPDHRSGGIEKHCSIWCTGRCTVLLCKRAHSAGHPVSRPASDSGKLERAVSELGRRR